MCGGWGGGGRVIPNLSPRGLALGLAPHPSPAKHDHSAYGGQAGDAGRMGSNVCGGWGLRRPVVGSLVVPRWCSLAGSPIVPGQTRQKSVSPAVKPGGNARSTGQKPATQPAAARPPSVVRGLSRLAGAARTHPAGAGGGIQVRGKIQVGGAKSGPIGV